MIAKSEMKLYIFLLNYEKKNYKIIKQKKKENFI